MAIYVSGKVIAESGTIGDVLYNSNNAYGNGSTSTPGNGGWGYTHTWVSMYDFASADDYTVYYYYADLQSLPGYQNMGRIWKVDATYRLFSDYQSGTQSQMSGAHLQMKQTSGADQRYSGGIIKIIKLFKLPG